MDSAGMSPAQVAAREAEWMAWEQAHRPPTASELHKAWMAALSDRYQVETFAASDWLLARVPGLRTPGGLACGIAIQALKGLRSQRPDIVGDELLAAVLAYRDGRLAEWDAMDLSVTA